jgi:hypothetical protein
MELGDAIVGEESDTGYRVMSGGVRGRSGEFAVVAGHVIGGAPVCAGCEGRGWRYVLSVLDLVGEGDGWRRVRCVECGSYRRRLAG